MEWELSFIKVYCILLSLLFPCSCSAENLSYLLYCIAKKYLTCFSVVCSMLMSARASQLRKGWFQHLLYVNTSVYPRDSPQGCFACQSPELYACIHLKLVWPGLSKNNCVLLPSCASRRELSSMSLKTALKYIWWNASTFLFLFLPLYPWRCSLFTAEAHFQRSFSVKKVICL